MGRSTCRPAFALACISAASLSQPARFSAVAGRLVTWWPAHQAVKVHQSAVYARRVFAALLCSR